MSTVPQLSVADLWAGLRDLALRLVADPALLAKVKALWDAITAFFPAVPSAGPEAEANAAIVADWLSDVPPEKLFDGTLIRLFQGISGFIDTHPQLIAFLLQFLAVIPMEDATV